MATKERIWEGQRTLGLNATFRCTALQAEASQKLVVASVFADMAVTLTLDTVQQSGSLSSLSGVKSRLTHALVCLLDD